MAATLVAFLQFFCWVSIGLDLFGFVVVEFPSALCGDGMRRSVRERSVMGFSFIFWFFGFQLQ